jgi:CHASE2 domain-containing sensor protein
VRQHRSEAGHLVILGSPAQIVLKASPKSEGKVRRSTQGALLALIGVSVGGTIDVAEFLATRSAMFTDAPGRAAGTVVGLALWLALLGVATARYARGERSGARSATLGLAGLVAAGNVGLTAIHLKVGVGGWRPFVGAVLGIFALILAVASRQTTSD